MPFRSKKQRRYMYAKHPEIAKRWAKKYGNKIHASKKKAKIKHKSNNPYRKLRG